MRECINFTTQIRNRHGNGACVKRTSGSNFILPQFALRCGKSTVWSALRQRALRAALITRAAVMAAANDSRMAFTHLRMREPAVDKALM